MRQHIERELLGGGGRALGGPARPRLRASGAWLGHGQATQAYRDGARGQAPAIATFREPADDGDYLLLSRKTTLIISRFPARLHMHARAHWCFDMGACFA